MHPPDPKAEAKTLRVLITHERFPPDFGGGGEYVVLRTATSLMAAGHDVRVLTAGDPSVTEHAGVPTERLAISRHAMNWQVGAIARAARAADIVHTFNYHASLPSLVAARRVGRPVVCGLLALFGDAWRRMRRPPVGHLYQAWERVLVTRRFDRMLMLSEPSLRMAVALGMPPEIGEVLLPAIDHERIRPPDRSRPVVAFAGRFDARKGFPHVIAAARQLPDIPFVAVGWGPDMAGLRAAAPANLEIVESVGTEAYYTVLSRARIFFFPSYAETFGIVVAEAMASGCAVVSSVDTLAFDGAQLAPGDEAGMVAALRRLWDDPEAADRAGTANRRRAEALRWEAYAARLGAIYGEVLAGRLARQLAA